MHMPPQSLILTMSMASFLLFSLLQHLLKLIIASETLFTLMVYVYLISQPKALSMASILLLSMEVVALALFLALLAQTTRHKSKLQVSLLRG